MGKNTVKEILKELKSYGDAATKKMLINNGAKEPVFGVKVADLKKIVKRVKKDHALSLELFATGNSDAMYLAALIADEDKISKSELTKWVNGAYWPWLSEFSVPWIAAESKHGYELALKWIDSKKENVASSGWGTLAYYASIKADDELNLGVYKKLLDRVEKNVHKDQNRVSHTMNAFVIAVGSYIKPLTKNALATAKKIGKVEVDMGKTACKVPLAVEAIKKVADRGAIGKKRKEITTMTLEETLTQLKALGTDKMRAQNRKNGAGENQFGVRLGDLRVLAKKIKRNHELAMALWKTKNIDARLLAILLINPKALSAGEMDRMVRSVNFVQVADWLNSYVVKHHPDKETLRQGWMATDDPMAARAGWSLTTERIVKSPEGLDLPALLDRIESEMGNAAPEVQWTMNCSLAEIGIHFPDHRERALAIGEMLGIYRDYPVSKGCTSPFAPIWINAMVSRQ